MSAVNDRLNRVKTMIENTRDDKNAIYKIPNVLVHCTLPQRDPGDIEYWERRQNGVNIRVHPYIDSTGVQSSKHFRPRGAPNKGKHLYPYGAFSRLLLYWIGWEAMSIGERKIYIGRSFHEFIKRFRIPVSGSRRQLVMSQMLRLFRCRIEFSQDTQVERRWRYLDFTTEGDLAWDETNVSGRLTAESYIVLGENFFQSLRRHPVPIDMRAVQALRHSVMALDLYTWSTYQAYRVSTAGNGPKIFPWKMLMHQFGADYRYPSEFKAKIPHVLCQVHHVYPELTVELTAEGLKLFPSRPAVLPDEKEEMRIEESN